MKLLELLFETFLELIQEGCFHLIRKHVRIKFLRGVLYVLTVLAVMALAFTVVIGLIWFGGQVVFGILDGIENLLFS